MMESSASPSGASSHATQTGRPSMWTDSGTRKLGRLYVYTTLPIKKILDVIHSTSPEETGPGKDSANKKLNALLDKEPRWLHPRTRTDMERRMNALAASPTRTRRREFPSPVSALIKTPASPIDGDYNYFPPVPATNDGHGGANAAATQPDMGSPPVATPSNPLDNYVNGQHVAFSQGNSNQVVDESLPDAEPIQPLNHAHRRIASFRRGTFMSTSTTLTTTTLRKALSEYSSGFIRHVKRVMKRYTMPVRTPQGPSPTDETRPPTACSTTDSWLNDDSAPLEITSAPPLPGDFLILDKLLDAQGPCPQGESMEHFTKNCLCRPAAIMNESIWMSETGLSERGQLLMQPGNATLADFEERDVFGNTLMHLLAARDADHMYILQLAAQGVSCRARNSAGQTFLHLLDPSWLTDARYGISPLLKLLQLFQADQRFFLARDCYGRTLFHVLRSKVQDPAPLNHLLDMLNIKLLRDAFGEAPSCTVDMPINPPRRAFTSVGQEPAPAPPLPRNEPDLCFRQARILEFVRQCQNEPATEDSQGRNGLHCLAAAILSGSTLERLAGGEGGTPGNPRKRKREADRNGDSSKERLTLRETIVNNLLASGVNPNSYDAAGNTPLMAFVAQLPEDDDYKVPVSILQLLIDAGADIEARNRRGETALHVAVRRGKKLAMRTLVQNGARVDVRDASGRGLLEVADEKMAQEDEEGVYMRYEAIRAWLSGQGRAVQEPTLLGEWAWR
ncbi:hypothetical protein VUR80DRAFT_6548 [Thermomyces stellatus]